MPNLQANLQTPSCTVAFHHQGAKKSLARKLPMVPPLPPKTHKPLSEHLCGSGASAACTLGSCRELVRDRRSGKVGIAFCQGAKSGPGAPSLNNYRATILPTISVLIRALFLSFFFLIQFKFTHYKILFFFWLQPTTCGILVPRPGIKPIPPAVEVWCHKHWTTSEVQI